jgi:hypothetical protein
MKMFLHMWLLRQGLRRELRRELRHGYRYLNRVMQFCLASVAAACVACAAGCASVEPAVYQNEKPVLDLKTYFNGTLDAWGLFQDRSGQVVKRFRVVITCSWTTVNGIETGTLDEDFTYADGAKQRRVWTLKKVAEHRYIGTADDVVGEAIGITAGNALNWKYVLALPVDSSIYNVDFNDWMYLMDDKTMLNRAAMSKFGVHLGDITLSFSKR